MSLLSFSSQESQFTVWRGAVPGNWQTHRESSRSLSLFSCPSRSLVIRFSLRFLAFLCFCFLISPLSYSSHPSPCPFRPILFCLSDWLLISLLSLNFFSSFHLHFCPSLFSLVCVSRDVVQTHNTHHQSQSFLPDEAAYCNHCLVSTGPLLQL